MRMIALSLLAVAALSAWPCSPALAAEGVIDTVAGNGSRIFNGDGLPALDAALGDPWGILAVDGDGSFVFSEVFSNRIRRVDGSTGIISTIGESRAYPFHLAQDGAGRIYFSDNSDVVRRLDPVTGDITIVAGVINAHSFGGDGGPAIEARLDGPRGIAVDDTGNLYITDTNNHRVRRVDAATGIIETVAGDSELNEFGEMAGGFRGDGGPARHALLNSPRDVVVTPDGKLYIADLRNHRIRMVDPGSRRISTVAGNGESGPGGDFGPGDETAISPTALALDTQGNIYFADAAGTMIRKLTAATGIVSTVAGHGSHGFSGDGGPARDAAFDFIISIAVDRAGDIYLTDVINERVRKVTFPRGGPSLSVSPAVLRPPNHEMVEVEVTAHPPAGCVGAEPILSFVVSSEPDDASGSGDGNTSFDIRDAAIGTADLTVSLRAERDAGGDGRVYTLGYDIHCDAGNVIRDTVQVLVPAGGGS